MKEFSAKLRFSAENEEEFNKYVSSRVIFWLKYTDTRETAVRRAIEDAISNQYCRIFEFPVCMGMNRLWRLMLTIPLRVPRVYGDEPRRGASDDDRRESSPCVWG